MEFKNLTLKQRKEIVYELINVYNVDPRNINYIFNENEAEEDIKQRITEMFSSRKELIKNKFPNMKNIIEDMFLSEDDYIGYEMYKIDFDTEFEFSIKTSNGEIFYIG